MDTVIDVVEVSLVQDVVVNELTFVLVVYIKLIGTNEIVGIELVDVTIIVESWSGT